MGKYGADPNQTFTKLEIARVQLEDAIDLFLAAKYLSAITLAGAADAIFAGHLGDRAPDKETWAEIVSVREQTGMAYGGERSEKNTFTEWNHVRNRLKHHEKDEVRYLS